MEWWQDAADEFSEAKTITMLGSGKSADVVVVAGLETMTEPEIDSAMCDASTLARQSVFIPLNLDDRPWTWWLAKLNHFMRVSEVFSGDGKILCTLYHKE